MSNKLRSLKLTGLTVLRGFEKFLDAGSQEVFLYIF
jgi:hypothetical protein